MGHFTPKYDNEKLSLNERIYALRAEKNPKKLRQAALLEDAAAGDTAVYGEVRTVLTEAILFCHKVALRNIAKHEDIVKYHEIIGYATRDIKEGEWVHIHNLDDVRGRDGMLS